MLLLSPRGFDFLCVKGHYFFVLQVERGGDSSRRGVGQSWVAAQLKSCPVVLGDYFAARAIQGSSLVPGLKVVARGPDSSQHNFWTYERAVFRVVRFSLMLSVRTIHDWVDVLFGLEYALDDHTNAGSGLSQPT
jgi:hypothetical protein